MLAVEVDLAKVEGGSSKARAWELDDRSTGIRPAPRFVPLEAFVELDEVWSR